MRQRLAGIPLAAGIAVAIVGGESLRRAGEDLGKPAPAGWGIAAFAAAILLAFVGGHLAGPAPEPPASPRGAREPLPGARALAVIGLGLASLALFGATWMLQDSLRSPIGAIAAWIGALTLGGAAVVAAFPEPRRAAPRPHAGLVAAIVAVVAIAAWARLAALDAVPAGFGGDEANQIEDAKGLLDGTAPGDPFGVGWYGTMRLGMLPAGVGALAFANPLEGPRLPYALAGTLSVAAAIAVAGWLAGGWAALAAGILIAAAPYHVHFSRLASVMIFDSLAAAAFLAAAFRTRRTGAPRHAFVAGAVAGLALYGYSAGRVLPILLLVAVPFLLRSDAARGRRLALVLTLAAGFLLAALPTLRFAARHFEDWNSRFNQVGIFRAAWWDPEVARLGSAWRVLERQLLAGTIGLFSRHTDSTWYTGYPIIGPSILPSLGIAGLGWLLGRRRFFAAVMLGLLVGSNLAAVVLTDTAPAPQRLSSLFPALAILGGIAFAGLASRFSRAGDAVPTVPGAALAAVLALASVPGLPPWWDPSPGYGGEDAAFALGASRALDVPRFREVSIYLDGAPYVDSGFPSFHYLLPRARFVNRDPSKDGDGDPPPGLHLLPSEWQPLAWRWRQRAGFRAAAIADPRDPQRDIAWLVRAP